MRLSGAFLFLPTNLTVIEIGVQIDPFQPDPDNAMVTPLFRARIRPM